MKYLSVVVVIFVSGCAQERTPPIKYPDACGSHVECFNKGLLALDEAYAALGRAQAQAIDLVPAGTVVAYAGSEAPPGWLLCNGQSFDRNDARYKRLFAAIGTTHGGSASPTFQIPDYRGVFLRGVSGNSGRDPDASSRGPMGANGTGNSGNAVGTYQADGVGSHPRNISGVHLQAKGGDGFDGAGLDTNSNRNHPMTRNYSTHSSGGSETRPRNVSVNYIIKL
ncbi:tail fiber protein [Sorangium sp. So ce295]|uniref:tail fiber protein n=1 Tax=Sorangium sp. So ce295 TaxID=3133295 RepID=UPI003F62AE36